MEWVHKQMILSSSTPISDEVLTSVVNGLQQELVGTAVLRHSSFYHVVDTSNEKKCVITLIWSPVSTQASLSSVVDTAFEKTVWRKTCDRYLQRYNLKCDWMVGIHPNYSNCKFLVYYVFLLQQTVRAFVLINTSHLTSRCGCDEPAAYLWA